jgi:hypothetical protein
METPVAQQKIFNLTATMNRMLVPDHYDGPRGATEQVFQKDNDFISSDRGAIGLQVQLDLAFPRTYTQGSDQVQALVVFDTRANGRGLPARCPSAFERRDQRISTFIEENEGCAKLLPLFLYVARCNVSNVQWLRHRGATRGVVVFGNSSLAAAKDTRRYGSDSALETDPRSDVQCDPRSSNLRHTRSETPRALGR